MNFQKLKKSLCLLMAGIMAAGLPVQAGASTVFNPADGLQVTPKTVEEILYDNQLPKVSENELKKFEADYDKNQGQLLKKMNVSQLAQDAKKRASILTSLYGVASVQYAVIKDGEIILSDQEGYSDRSKKTAPDKDTMYGICSISKILTTTAVMQLVEDGKIELDKPVTAYIPEFKMADERYKDITVRMLLNHSSGLMGTSCMLGLLFDDPDTKSHDTLLKNLQSQRLKADPGAFSVYCNDGFLLAELVVERVADTTFSNYVAKEITGPLGMDGTKSPQDSFSRSRLAKIYQGTDTKALPVDCFNGIGTGGYYSTAEDLCRLATVFMDENNTILSSGSVQATLAEEYKRGMWVSEDAGILGYGLGWDDVSSYPFSEYGIKGMNKGGDSLYYHGQLIALPEKNMAVAVLTSGGSSAVDQIFGASILLDYLKDQGEITEFKDTSKKASLNKGSMPPELKEYSGFYGNASGTLKVDVTDGTLTLSSAMMPDSKSVMNYNDKGEFVDAAGNNTLKFIKETNGRTYIVGGSYGILGGIGDTYSFTYQAEKLEHDSLPADVKKVWNERNNKAYFSLKQKYSSQMYINSSVFSGVTFASGLEDYLGSSRIADKDTALACLQIPMSGGRDLSDYTFYTSKGKEYLKTGEDLFVKEDALKNLSSKSKFKLTIGSVGHAKWYKIGSKSANKKIKVTLPKKGSYAVYDKDGKCINHSYVSGKTTTKLPKGGYIVFAGDKNQKFTVKYLK